jgi:hypothetical protein
MSRPITYPPPPRRSSFGDGDRDWLRRVAESGTDEYGRGRLAGLKLYGVADEADRKLLDQALSKAAS